MKFHCIQHTAKEESQAKCLQLLRLTDTYLKQRTAIKNKIHEEKTLGTPSKAVFSSLNRSLKALEKEIKLLEEHLTELVKEHQQSQLTLLKSIPGMGVKTALMLIVMTDGFNRFENGKQLCGYVGITPAIRDSGK